MISNRTGDDVRDLLATAVTSGGDPAAVTAAATRIPRSRIHDVTARLALFAVEATATAAATAATTALAAAQQAEAAAKAAQRPPTARNAVTASGRPRTGTAQLNVPARMSPGTALALRNTRAAYRRAAEKAERQAQRR